MARTRVVGTRSIVTSRHKQLKESINNLQLLAVLTDADNCEEESDALTFAKLVVAAKQQMLLSGGGWYGIKGAYKEPKSKDFFDLLL